ncbi:hypothetical protein [Actinoallomurus acaciae]|uniref:Transcriptional regulator Rv0078-like C-terminal domain-containing protein n=1 Tax=Actinoallomurus acaciae TaxID=502577 RepID=A0ABV5YZ65_9ACTN
MAGRHGRRGRPPRHHGLGTVPPDRPRSPRPGDERATGGIVCQPVERLTEAGVITPVDISVTGRLICAVVAEAALSPAAADDPRPARRAASGNRAQGHGPESIR